MANTLLKSVRYALTQPPSYLKLIPAYTYSYWLPLTYTQSFGNSIAQLTGVSPSATPIGAITGVDANGQATLAVWYQNLLNSLKTKINVSPSVVTSYTVATATVPAHYETIIPPKVFSKFPVVGWNGSAISINGFHFDGNTEFSISDSSAGVVAGLNTPDATDSGYLSIKYGIFAESGQYRIIENGVFKTTPSSFTTANVFKIEKIGDVVSYYVDNVLIYDSLTPSTDAALTLDASLYLSGDSVLNAAITDLPDSFTLPSNDADCSFSIGGLSMDATAYTGNIAECDFSIGGLDFDIAVNEITVTHGFCDFSIGGLDFSCSGIGLESDFSIGGFDFVASAYTGNNADCSFGIGGLDFAITNGVPVYEETVTESLKITDTVIEFLAHDYPVISEALSLSDAITDKMPTLALTYSTENTGLSTYTNMPFIGSCSFNGKLLLINENGLFEYGGVDDCGTPVVASIKTNKSNKALTQQGLVNSNHRKRNPVSKVYVNAENTLPLTLNVTVDSDSQSYPDAAIKPNMSVHAIKIGRGFDGVHWQLEVIGFDKIESIEHELVEIRRRGK